MTPIQTASLPRPQRERWQPLRSGFINLYRYDREEFHYENGRMLLRGNNGTGKSRVLALQLPFLLDGEVNPERLEPDADPSKKIEWNLLMGRHSDRTGYTWIEFGCRESGGKENYLTLGCGLSAIKGQPGIRLWFFITRQRIGKDLELVSESKQVLGKDRLQARIGAAGAVFDKAGAYRRAVNEALFHLDESRYAGLVNLLIQLRRPQLTRRLDETELSRALSEALPPVSSAVIANVAEAFRDLQSDRTRLESSKVALAAVEQFLAGYRDYVQVAAKRRAERVLRAHDEFEAAMKEVLTAEAECDRSLAELARLKNDMQRHSLEEHALETEIAGFEQSPQMTDVQSLERAHREALEKHRDANSAAAELADAAHVRRSLNEEHLRVRANLEQCRLRLVEATEAAARAAISGGFEHTHKEHLGAQDLQLVDDAASKHAREKIDAAVRTQIEKAEHLEGLNEAVALAKNECQRVAAERDLLSGLLDDARERLNAARGEHQAAVTAFLGAASEWTADLTELPLPFDESFLRSVAQWCDRPEGANPFVVASLQAVEELNVSFAETRAYLKHLEKTHIAELNQLERENESLMAGEFAGSADEAHRSRLAEVQSAIVNTQAQLDPVMDSIDELNRRQGILRTEALTAPPDAAVRAAYEYSVAVSRHVDGLRSRLAEIEKYVSQKQSQLEQITENRDRAAADLGLAKWIDDLRTLKDGIAQYRLALSRLWSAASSFQETQRTSEWIWRNVQQAAIREERQKEVANRFERRAVVARIAHEGAGRVVDTRADEVFAQMARKRERLDALRIEEKEARKRYHDTEVAVTRLDERLRSRTAVLNANKDRRDTAASSLRTFASTGLLKLIVPELNVSDPLRWSARHTVEVALELASRLSSIDGGDAAWEYHQRYVPTQFTSLMQTLAAKNCESSAVYRDDVFVASAVFTGQQRTMDELRQALFDSVATRQMLLEARAREILENRLVGKVSGHLRELLRAAEQQVLQMNIELESRPMSTGMKLRFVWGAAPDAPSGMVEARQILMQSNDDWSASERQTLGMFLQHQVEAVFSEIEGASWEESLAQALDYRQWHWFSVERYQDGIWKRLTARTYGTGSGGEKAVALTLPHFAAAAAFYRTADPRAPRLILLDEAFVGIDADMRAKCMGLIDVFDLDFMMTSEREWACYQTLPGIAIYQLSTRPEIDAIGLTRWVWNGRQRSLSSDLNSNESSQDEDGGSTVRVQSTQA